jgi:hypothetical protein
LTKYPYPRKGYQRPHGIPLLIEHGGVEHSAVSLELTISVEQSLKIILQHQADTFHYEALVT